MSDRPLLVSILAILDFISGAVAILLGLAVMLLGTILFGVLAGILGIPSGALSFLGVVLGVIIIGVGAFTVIRGYGLWTLKKWALYLMFIGLGLGLLLNLYSLVSQSSIYAIFGIAYEAILLWYFWDRRDHFD